MNNNQIYIRFRNTDNSVEIFMSPIFQSPDSLMENEDLENLLVDGDPDTNFFFSCDVEWNNSNGVTKLIWLMFEPYDEGWIKDLMIVWKHHLNCELPSWDCWVKVPNLDKAYDE